MKGCLAMAVTVLAAGRLGSGRACRGPAGFQVLTHSFLLLCVKIPADLRVVQPGSATISPSSSVILGPPVTPPTVNEDFAGWPIAFIPPPNSAVISGVFSVTCSCTLTLTHTAISSWSPRLAQVTPSQSCVAGICIPQLLGRGEC